MQDAEAQKPPVTPEGGVPTPPKAETPPPTPAADLGATVDAGADTDPTATLHNLADTTKNTPSDTNRTFLDKVTDKFSRPTGPEPTLEQKLTTHAGFKTEQINERDALQNTPTSELKYPGTNQQFQSEAQAEAWKRERLEQLNNEIGKTEAETKEMQDKRDPDKEGALKKKIEDRKATLEDLEEYDNIIRTGKEGNPGAKNTQEEFDTLAKKITEGSGTDQDRAKYVDLKEQLAREKLADADQKWKEKAASGENPADELVDFINQFNEENDYDALTDREVADLKGFMKDVYEGGVTGLEGFEKSRIRDKFVELGKIEARILALKETVKNMKKQEGTIKADVNAAEMSYLSESNPDIKMQKLAAWRQKALKLEGYQMAINGQAARGREENIKRRQAAGFIHRKLGTKGLAGNIGFGLVTAGAEMSDAFQDVAIDPFRDKFA